MPPGRDQFPRPAFVPTGGVHRLVPNNVRSDLGVFVACFPSLQQTKIGFLTLLIFKKDILI